MSSYFIGIDVGTGSARSGIFTADGTLLASAKRPISIWREEGGCVEQSSDDIWTAVCGSVRAAVAEAGVPPKDVAGLGFDATCSLVALDSNDRPVAVGFSGDSARNVIVWMDHRATEQAQRINSTGHPVLRYVGGRISPEMETPKLLWLKENLPEGFEKVAHFLDLADFLSYRATGALERSLCTVTCKWTYLAHEGRFDPDYFRAIGLGELAEDGFARIGTNVVDIATPLGSGLTEKAASELGLKAGIAVGASLIDAHAGGVGTLGGKMPDGNVLAPENALAFIMGTSACSMAVSRNETFVDGVWGPYYGAMLPGYWLLEGGQSAYGAALDHLVSLHPAYANAKAAAERDGRTILDDLERRAVTRAGSIDDAARLAERITVVPEFLGNRAPEADPDATAVIAGLTLDSSPDNLTDLFVAGLCGLCYGTRQIVEANRSKGIEFTTIVVSGGAARSRLLRRILADATGLAVATPSCEEPVLLGSAMIGMVASGTSTDLRGAATAMCHLGEVIEPAGGKIATFHEAKYRAFRMLQTSEREIRKMIELP